MLQIEHVSAIEVLDSRGRPTLAVSLALADGTVARGGVPAGASTGGREARELRDGEPGRFDGQGVRRAVGNVNGEIAAALCGRRFADVSAVDQVLIDLDGTPDKGRLGANAVVGVSIAAARAAAIAADQPMWRTLALAGSVPRTPVPHFNVVNGGLHAPNDLDFQEFMLAPVGAPTVAEAVRAGAEIYAVLRRRLVERRLSVGLGDEGGFAPELTAAEDVLSLLVDAIGDAGYPPALDGVALAIDPAASQFYRDGAYRVAGETVCSGDMIDRYEAMVERFPIRLIEDGLAESDWDGWQRLTARLGDRVQVVGDDLLCTNPAIIAQAVERKAANAALIKVNQIGTVTENLRAIATCRRGRHHRQPPRRQRPRPLRLRRRQPLTTTDPTGHPVWPTTLEGGGISLGV